jgi:ABC-2 type transport system ATP-binding protein
MRQRLGIAQALIGDPEVLILDEPVNGLDPEGIRWTRGLLRDFAARGGTVLLSSHLLSEVEATADRLVVIGRGQIVAQGTLAQLQGSAGTFVRSLDPSTLSATLRTAGVKHRPAPDGGLAVDADPETVGRHAAAAGVVLVELRSDGGTPIEQLFFDLTSQPADAALPAQPAA